MTALPPPHTPFDWHASPVVQALLSLQLAPVVTTQVAVAAEQAVQVPQAAPEFCQAPNVLHTCGWVKLHPLSPGTQDPVH